jgi:hypothetical protein
MIQLALLLLRVARVAHVTTAATNVAAAPPPPPVLWLPLGDSITWGCGTDAAPRGDAVCTEDAGGYRVPLAWALSQRGIALTTVRAARGRLSGVSVSHRKSVLYGVSVWARTWRLTVKIGGFWPGQMGTLTTGPAYVPAAWLRHEGHPGARIGLGLLLCTNAHPLHTRSTNIFGTSISEATMRPDPRRGSTRSAPSSRRAWPARAGSSRTS